MQTWSLQCFALQALNDQCFSTQIDAVCNSAAPAANCDTNTVAFSDDGSGLMTSVTFIVTLLDSTSPSDVEAIFNALVTAAEGDTLVSGEVVLANTVGFDTCKLYR